MESTEPGNASDERERVLFVHAHPDDETIATGGTIAALVERGAIVTVLTCTRGELGEAIPADLRGLEGSNRMAAHRERELAAAMNILGVRDHRWLGQANARWPGREPRRYTDSGMRWGASGAEPLPAQAPDSLCAAEFGEVASDIASVIEAVNPTAVVSYDASGGYRHPDHIRTHETALRAADVMGVPFFAVQPDGVTGTIAIDYSAVVERKKAALVAYRSQVTVTGEEFALSSGAPRPIAAPETYARVREPEQEPAQWKDQGLGVHIVAYLLAVIVGVIIGSILAVEHQYTVKLGSWTAPVGVAASLAIVAAWFIGCRIVFESRLVALFAGIGAMTALVVFSLAGAGDSVLIPANAAGYTLLYGGAAFALVVVLWPVRKPRRDKLGTTVEPKGSAAP